MAASQLPIRALIKEDLPLCPSAPLQQHLGFAVVGESLWMVRGVLPALSLNDVYGLACLELG